MTEVFLSESIDHYNSTIKIMNIASSTIINKIKKSSMIVIKPNFVSTYRELSATPLDTTKAILEYISKIYKGDIIIAEGSAMGDLREGLKNFGYYTLKDMFNIEFIDLNKDDYETFTVWDTSLRRKIKVRVAKTILESDYIISPARPKTHDTVIVTLSIKNVVMGAVQRGYKTLMHQGYKGININIAYLATYMLPSLSIVDGLIGMQGNGPVIGDPIDSNFILLSQNPVSADSIATVLMGFDPGDIGYIYYLYKLGFGEIDYRNIFIQSEKDWKNFIKKYRPHATYRRQLKWKLSHEIEKRILSEIKEEINTL